LGGRRGGRAPPHGTLWQAAATLDEFSQAALESAGILAQANAVRFGGANRAASSLMLPVLPEIPRRRGAFHDFQCRWKVRLTITASPARCVCPPGRQGRRNTGLRQPYRLGPWARLYRWRDYTSHATRWEWVPPEGGYGQTRAAGATSILAGGRSAARRPTRQRRQRRLQSGG